MARLPEGVDKVEYKSGAVRYEVRVDAEVNGVRRQQRRRFKTVAEATAYRKQAIADSVAGKLVPSTDLTVKQAIEEWLDAQRVAPGTAAAYESALAPVVERYGRRRVQTIEKSDVEKLISDLRDGNGPGGRRWSRNTINPMRARWQSVWADLVEQGKLGRNPVELVKPLRKRDDPVAANSGMLDLSDRLTDVEVEALRAAHPATPPAEGHMRSAGYIAAMRAPMIALGLLGLRRGEMAGLRWSSVDLDKRTMKVAETTRIAVRGKVIEQNVGKTRSASRWLPVPEWALLVLREANARQEVEKKRYGAKWLGGDDGYVLTQQNGRPTSPRTLDSWWRDSLVAAGVPHRRLHAARHTTASWLIAMGRSPAEVAMWLGHSDGGELVLRTYSHVHQDDLRDVAAALDYTKERVMPEDRGPVHPLQEEIPPRLLAEMGFEVGEDGQLV
ncbi:tyrosine-type recombinase/integrase [Gordonia sp. (in: high G+C Gram-positive bacteria)]|uniref:tyrosine-type recombinase/integrase n=1 Tax=Gordonia sp. (in: high G+C Gram-positive bacteria) TaxID=84139 RepID=UPI002CB1A549|nr:site-specific integrase [Gordonia sp. (in: high G+C Gram-positive bacteria)]HMS73911.1 site-specific integrase [Gordonia sp. (in: high G+C Gram-positive bacteria)]